ncbi:MAG: PAS domain S-box protein [Thiomargarita sp.]|nr:PAS domain S-box protein [Thiomargarita sp.]
MKNHEENITKRILIPLGLTLLLLLTISMISIYWLQRLHFNEDIERHLKEVEQLFQMKLNEDAKVLESQINLLQLNKNLQEAYIAKDRETLRRHAAPFFNAIRAKYQVTHFYFINLDRMCFLRVHNPQRYGDIIPRFTLDGAVHKDIPVYGIELGKFGTFTLRMVYPWKIKGKLIGYIELGKEIEHITVAIKKIIGVELFFAVNKSLLNRADWEEGLRMMKRTGDWARFPSVVIIDRTMPVMPQKLKAYISSPSLFSKHKHLTAALKLSIDDKSYRGGFVPLIDAGHREVGHITVLNDISEKETALNLLLFILIGITVLIGGALFGFFYFFISRIETRLVKTRNKLIENDKEIRGQHNFLQNVLNSLSHPFYVINVKDFTLKIANAAAGFDQLKENSICYVLAHHNSQPCNSDEQACPLAEIQKTKKSAIVEHIYYNKQGKAVNTEVHGHPIFDEQGNIKEMAVYTIDITERKREVEKALQEREAQYYGIFNAATDAFLIFNFAKRIVEANIQAQKMYGYSKDEFAILPYKNIVHPDHYPIFEGFLSDIQNSGEFHTESVNIRKAGTAFEVEIRGSSFSYKGTPHLLVVIRDITEHKQMLEKLAQAKEAAETANYAKSAFLANMSHELRTPLHAILGFAQILEEEKNINSEEAQKSIRIIYKSGENLLLLLNDILDITRIETGKLQLNPKDFFLHDFLKRIAEIIQLRAEQKNINFTCDFQSELPNMVNGDVIRLRQMLINLLGNAVKFTATGFINFKVSQLMNKTFFQIKDTGCGIAPDELKTLFQPFNKIGDYTHKTEGSGLGLSLSKQLIEMMGGQLNVKSTLNEGSVFWFDLILTSDWQQMYEPKSGQVLNLNSADLEKGFDQPINLSTPISDRTEMVGPPNEVAKMLYNLAMQGDISRLSEEVVKLKKDEKLKPYITKLLQLTSEFKVQKIREFILMVNGEI